MGSINVFLMFVFTKGYNSNSCCILSFGFGCLFVPSRISSLVSNRVCSFWALSFIFRCIVPSNNWAIKPPFAFYYVAPSSLMCELLLFLNQLLQHFLTDGHLLHTHLLWETKDGLHTYDFRHFSAKLAATAVLVFTKALERCSSFGEKKIFATRQAIFFTSARAPLRSAYIAPCIAVISGLWAGSMCEPQNCAPFSRDFSCYYDSQSLSFLVMIKYIKYFRSIGYKSR